MEKVKNVLTTALEWVKGHLKIIVPVAVALVVVVFAIGFLTGGPKRAVKKYVSAINSRNASKLVKSVDVIGAQAWVKCQGEEDDFKDAYDEVKDDEDEDDLKDEREESAKDMFDNFDDNYDSYKMKIVKFKGTKKLKKDLYEVKVQIETKTKDKDGDKDEDTDTVKFIVYKNKVISQGY